MTRTAAAWRFLQTSAQRAEIREWSSIRICGLIDGHVRENEVENLAWKAFQSRQLKGLAPMTVDRVFILKNSVLVVPLVWTIQHILQLLPQETQVRVGALELSSDYGRAKRLLVVLVRTLTLLDLV